MVAMLKIINDFFNLIYPNICVICDEKLVTGEQMFCTNCLSDIPKTNFDDIRNNPVAELFWGRAKLEGAISLFYFNSGSKYRKLLHKLKYSGQKDIGIKLGRMLGDCISKTPLSLVDVILPVPLHPKRLRTRGYNQSEYIADGIAQVIDKPVLNEIMERKIFNVSQTGKGRLDRWTNVEGIFNVKNPYVLIKKHVLLVDDIVTTGSTLEACAISLLNAADCTVSVSTLAVTKS